MARIVRSRQSPAPSSLDLLEAFCTAQYRRLTRGMLSAQAIPSDSYKLGRSGIVTDMDLDSRRTPGLAPLRMGPKYADGL